MESEDRLLREDDVGRSISSSLRELRVHVAMPVWRDVEWSARVIRRRRRLFATAAAAASFLVVVGLAIAVVRDPQHGQQIATDRDPTTVGVAPPSAGRNAALTSVLSLSPCHSVGDLERWSRTAVLPYGEISSDQPQVVSLAEATTNVPILGHPANAACTVALRLGDSWAWEARGDNGKPVARFVSMPWLNRRVPDRMLEPDRASFYHQEWLPSGQSFTGVIRGSDLEALVRLGERSALVVGAITSLNAKDHADGVALLSDLYAEPLPAIPEAMRQYIPALVPVGFGLCSFQEGTPPKFVLFCDTQARTIRVSSSWTEHFEPPREATPIRVKKFHGVLGYADDGQRRIDLSLGKNLGTAYLKASADIAVDDLLETLASIPFLDPRLGEYRVGTGDAREFVTEDGLRGLVERSGGTAVSVRPLIGIGISAGTFTVEFKGPSGETANAVFKAVPDDEDPQVPPGDRIVEVGSIDFSVVEKPDVYASGQRVQQLYGVCNRVFVNVTLRPVPGDQAIDFTRGIVADLGC